MHGADTCGIFAFSHACIGHRSAVSAASIAVIGQTERLPVITNWSEQLEHNVSQHAGQSAECNCNEEDPGAFSGSNAVCKLWQAEAHQL